MATEKQEQFIHNLLNQLGNLIKHKMISYGYSFSNSRKLKNFNQNGIIGKSVFDNHTFQFDFNSKFCLVE